MNDITTTKNETYSHDDSANMAWMVYRRFGRDLPAAASAWRRLLQNSCTDAQFRELVRQSELNDEEG